MKDLVFITGNQGKADYLAKLLGVDIEHIKIELDEIQSTKLQEVVEHKVRQAFDVVKRPVLVEDVAMGLDALGGLPGPFIKYFAEAENGLENICRIANSFDSRRASARCMFGYYDGDDMRFFVGELYGEIADHPRGDKGFGWDKVFCPDGYDKRTRAELMDTEYDDVYQVIRPFKQLRDFLTK